MGPGTTLSANSSTIIALRATPKRHATSRSVNRTSRTTFNQRIRIGVPIACSEISGAQSSAYTATLSLKVIDLTPSLSWEIGVFGGLKEQISLNIDRLAEAIGSLSDELISIKVCRSAIELSDRKRWEIIVTR